MRWKLVLIASLIATIIGAGATFGIIFGFLGSTRSLATHDMAVLGTLLIPVVAIILAGLFVYRHTARRRPLQAMLTVLLAGLLTLTTLIIGSILCSKPAPAPTPTPRPRNISQVTSRISEGSTTMQALLFFVWNETDLFLKRA